jgi:hypothetical protein
MSKLIHEVLTEVNKQKTKKDKIKVLKQNETWGLKDIIRGSMDPTVVWNLPGGDPPYTACEPQNAPANLQRENTKFAYLRKGFQGDDLPPYKRESILFGILEGVDPGDAALVVDMINKKTPAGLTKPIVEEAFPGLLKG